MIKAPLALMMLLLGLTQLSFANAHEIAITIDDLPFVGSGDHDARKLQRKHDRFMSILNTLVEEKVPATGFVIGGTIEKGQWELLEAFRDNGFIIGNHTYSHLDANHTAADKYIDNIERTDQVLSPLLSHPKYFRFPYLAEGRGQAKGQISEYLSKNDYVIAPVTIDSKDYEFNERLYRIPFKQRPAHLNSMKNQYLNYIWKQTVRAEKLDKSGSKRQILLIHANLLNSYFLKDIITMYREKGYEFISLPKALESNTTSVIETVQIPKADYKNLSDARTPLY